MAAYSSREPIFLEEGSTRPLGYKLEGYGQRPLYVVGSYEAVCGGCDSIKTQDEIVRRVEMWAPLGDVIFEGLLLSNVFGRWNDLAYRLRPTPFIWAFLDTPLELCLERINQRRAAKGVTEPVNPHNTTAKWTQIRSCASKVMQLSSLNGRWLDHRDPVTPVLEWLR
jgi:hypothetical protein